LKAAAGQVKTIAVTMPSPSSGPQAQLARDISAALDWWRAAGVDHDFADAARDWLAAPAPVATELPPPAAVQYTAPAPAPPTQITIDRAGWPQDLPAFADWWLTEPSLDGGQISGRVPPRGPKDAAMMVLVDQPEAGDSHLLLAGEQGRLVNAILSALGIDPDQTYFASLLPRHTPMADWAALGEAGLGELALHHVKLAMPKRLISFGPHVSSLLGHDRTKSAEPLQQFYHVGPSIPALAAPGQTTLMARPRGKAVLWQALLDWQTT
jgi:uracil-DNA glycosylase